MTGLGWLIVLALIAFFATIGIRLAPMYTEAFNVRGSLESLKQEPFITQKSPREIVTLLRRRFSVNDITSVDPKSDITISKEGGILKVAIDYEIRRHALGNIDVVGVFHERIEVVEH